MMPRVERIIPEDGAMHIMCRGNNKQTILSKYQDKSMYYCLLKKYKEENRVHILHYCLMNNHVHLIVKLNSQSLLSRFMKQVNLSYFFYYKNIYDYCGHMWQDRFKSNLIETDIYLLQCGKYIELNPVRAGLVASPEMYTFSSYNYYANGHIDTILSPNPLYIELSTCPEKRKKRFRNFVLDQKVVCHDAFANHLFIGNLDFISKMEGLYEVANAKKKKGRPKEKNPAVK
ncbi:MAG: transposase [Candidatus Aminicenantes bacterium]|nr:MAG: transposase [Candidatus Aminicenantes bacterium]